MACKFVGTLPALAAALTAGGSVAASNVTVVDFGRNGVSQAERLNKGVDLAASSNGVFNTGTPTTPTAFFDNLDIDYDEATSLIPTPEGWTVEPGKTQTLYGGWETVGDGNRVFEFATYSDSGSGDFIRVGLQERSRAGFNDEPDNNLGNAFGFLGFVPKSAFLNGGDDVSAPVALTPDTVITITGGANNNGQDRRLRLVVKQDGQYYIGTPVDTNGDQVFGAILGGNVSTNVISSTGNLPLSAYQFEEYDPFSSVYFGDSEIATNPLFTGTFDDIEGIGFYFETQIRPGNGASVGPRVLIREFKVETVIPEPASLALVAAGVALGLTRRRDRV